MEVASERNKRRALRRRALRLHVRRDFLKRFVIDGPDPSIVELIAEVRANRGKLPAGLVSDPELAREVEEAVLLPFALVIRALSGKRTAGR